MRARSPSVLCVSDCSRERYAWREGARAPGQGETIGKMIARRAHSRETRITGAAAGSRCGRWKQRAVEVDIARCLEGVECESGGVDVMR